MTSLLQLLRALGSSRWRRRLLVLGASLGLTFLPLVGTLGYESALLLAPLYSLLAAMVGIDGVRQLRARGFVGSPARALDILGGMVLPQLLVLWGLGFAVLWGGQLWQPACDGWSGIPFFVLGPGVSMLLGAVVGIWAATITARPALQGFLALVFLLTSGAAAVGRLYFDPCVFGFNPFSGYFSGAIYDEDVAVTTTYVIYRIYNGVVALASLLLWTLLVDPLSLRPRWSLRGFRSHPKRGTVAIGLVMVAAAAGLHPTRLGFHANAESIARVLRETHRTEHFVIHYEPRSAAAREIEAIGTEHEFAWHRLERLLGVTPPGPVHSFVFSDSRQKRVCMGAGDVEVAAPWRGHIYLDHEPYPHGVLHHELAHVFAGVWGDPILGISGGVLRPNMGLVEGFAVALEQRVSSGLELHDRAAVLDRLEKRPPLADVMSPAFISQSGSLAYTAAGSFCLWLSETRGLEALTGAYASGGDFEGVCGQSLESLEAEWVLALRSRAVDAADVQRMEQRFRHPAIFARPCAHRAANIQQQIFEAGQAGRGSEVLSLQELLLRLEPQVMGHRLGRAVALARVGELAAAVQEVDGVLARDDLTVSLRAAAEELRGELALRRGDGALAVAAWRAALDLPVAEGRRRALQLKLWASRDPALQGLVQEYFAFLETERDSTSLSVLRLGVASEIRDRADCRGVGAYLMARQLAAVQAPALAAERFREALTGGGLPAAEFVWAARMGLLAAVAQSGFRYGGLAEARGVIDDLRTDSPTTAGELREVERWEERISYLESRAARLGQ